RRPGGGFEVNVANYLGRKSMKLRRLIIVLAGVGSLVLVAATQAAAPVGQYVRKGAYRYVSAPKLAPPILKAVKRGSGKLAPGYFLIANFKNLGALTSSGAPQPLVGQG